MGAWFTVLSPEQSLQLAYRESVGISNHSRPASYLIGVMGILDMDSAGKLRHTTSGATITVRPSPQPTRTSAVRKFMPRPVGMLVSQCLENV